MARIKLVEGNDSIRYPNLMEWSAFRYALNKSGMMWHFDTEWERHGVLSLTKDGKSLELTIKWKSDDAYNRFYKPYRLRGVSFHSYAEKIPVAALAGVNNAKSIPALVRGLGMLVDMYGTPDGTN